MATELDAIINWLPYKFLFDVLDAVNSHRITKLSQSRIQSLSKYINQCWTRNLVSTLAYSGQWMLQYTAAYAIRYRIWRVCVRILASINLISFLYHSAGIFDICLLILWAQNGPRYFRKIRQSGIWMFGTFASKQSVLKLRDMIHSWVMSSFRP